jgi:uncharacterized membrane protein SpoIIM required for sporulation
MTLESLTTPLRALNRPWEMLLIGFLHATVAVFLASWIFRAYSSLIMVLITVLVSVPLMYSTMRMEERKASMTKDEADLLEHHGYVLRYLLFMFIGFLLAFSVWFIVLPGSIVQSLFSSQLETIEAINTKVVGSAIGSGTVFLHIFLNNFKVLLFSLFFAFFFGAGAIFILTWNASVISAAVGSFAKERLAAWGVIGSANVVSYFGAFSLGLLRYIIHGLPEIAAYFVGGLAGGIISVAMINRDLETGRFKNIMLDAVDLILVAIALLLFAAFLEVYVTPLFF